MANEVVVAKDFSLPQLERMAQAIAKSNMFAVKTPEGALTLFLIAQAEGITPVQAMMDYDLIQGKPCLKSSAMLARFQRSGGKVEWLERTNERVTARFTHPQGSITVTWDNDRVHLAGLSGKENHKLFPLQMKAARCISEGVRAIAPQSIPLNMYTVEETRDMEVETPVIESVEAAVEAAVKKSGLSEEELDDLVMSMDCRTLAELKSAFAKAWKRAREMQDPEAQARIKLVYDTMRNDIESGAIS